MRVRGLLLAVCIFSGVGCGVSVHDLCLDECNKLNSCGAPTGEPDCNTQCPDVGIEVTSTSACKDIGAADACINAISASGDSNACLGEVSSCLSQNC